MAIKPAQGVVRILDKATAPLRAIAGAFRNLGDTSKKTNTDLSRTQKAINGISTAQNRLNRVNANMKKNTKDIGSQAVGVAALAYSFKSMLQPSIDFESSMADVRKVVDFESPEQFKNMQKDIMKLGKVLPLAHSGIASLVAAGGQAGFARKDLVAFALDAGKMATAFDDLEAKDAGEMMAKWRTAFSMNQDEVRSLADQINYLSNKTASSTTVIADIVTRVGSLGGVAGVSSSNLAAIGTTMSSVGVRSEVAATGIQNLLLSLVSGSQATKQQRRGFEQLGLTSEGVARGMQKDSSKTILTVLEGIKKLNAVDQTPILVSLFGKESIKSIAPLLTNLDNLKQSMGFVADSSKFAGSMQKEFESRSATTENTLQLLGNSVSGVAITFGTILLPAIQNVSKVISAILSPVSDLIEGNSFLAKTIGVVAAMLLSAKIVALAYTAAMWLTIPAISGLKWVLTAVKAPLITFNALMTANPIGLVVAAIGLLIIAGTTLYTYWEPIGTFFSELWETIKALDFSKILNFLSQLVSPLGMLMESGKMLFGIEEAKPQPQVATPAGALSPQMATQAIQASQTNNIPVGVNISIVDNKIKGVETKGATTSDVFLNDGRQF